MLRHEASCALLPSVAFMVVGVHVLSVVGEDHLFVSAGVVVDVFIAVVDGVGVIIGVRLVLIAYVLVLVWLFLLLFLVEWMLFLLMRLVHFLNFLLLLRLLFL